MMNCIIIDDDRLSRKVLEEYVQKTDFLHLVSSFSSAVEAISTLKGDNEIQLIFLDIEMPEMTGIEFLNTLKNPPQVIIVSSKEKYALEAFQYNVTDYLLKPVGFARFYKAADKAHSRIFKAEIPEKTTNKEIFIKKNNSLIRLKYDEIFWIEALENYIVINTNTDSFTIHYTMKAISDIIPAERFLRVHRSFIVNVDKINIIEDNAIIIKTQGKTKAVPIGMSYREELMKNIKKLTT